MTAEAFVTAYNQLESSLITVVQNHPSFQKETARRTAMEGGISVGSPIIFPGAENEQWQYSRRVEYSPTEYSRIVIRRELISSEGNDALIRESLELKRTPPEVGENPKMVIISYGREVTDNSAPSGKRTFHNINDDIAVEKGNILIQKLTVTTDAQAVKLSVAETAVTDQIPPPPGEDDKFYQKSQKFGGNELIIKIEREGHTLIRIIGSMDCGGLESLIRVHKNRVYFAQGLTKREGGKYSFGSLPLEEFIRFMRRKGGNTAANKLRYVLGNIVREELTRDEVIQKMGWNGEAITQT